MTKEYYQAHREECITRAKKWALANPDKKRANGQRYKKNHKDKIAAAGRKYYFKNITKIELKRDIYRFYNAMRDSRRAAKRHGYLPCTATAEEIKMAFTGFCFACGVLEGKPRLCVDHCHTTGKFCGWLCKSCNLALGNLKDSTKRIEALGQYLRKSVTR